MPSFRKYVGGKTLTAKALGKRKIVGKILNVSPEVLKNRDGQETERLCILVEDERKLIPLNVGNAERLGEHWGEDYEDWIGRPVIVTTHKTKFAGKDVDGILVSPMKDSRKR